MKRILGIKSLAILLSIVLSSPATALDAVRWGSHTWDHARLLPAGQTVLEVRGQTQSPDAISTSSSQANSDGIRNLGFKQTLRNVFESSENSEQLLKAAKDNGVDLNQVVSEAELEVDRIYSETQIRWSHSLTNWWMLGLSVPYVQSTTRVRVKTSNNEPVLAGNMKLQGNNPAPQLDIKEFRKMIADRDWDQLSEEMTYNGLGNLELLSQLRLKEGRRYYLSLRNRILVPAGSNKTAYQPIPMGPEDGQLSLGSDVLADWSPSPRVLITGVVGYTWQVQDQVEARVPNENESRWFWDLDPNVDRDLGDIILARINGSFRVHKKLWLTSGFEQFQKLRDEYRGSEFSREQYQQMKIGTDFTRRLARVGLRYQPPFFLSAQETRSYAAGLEYITTLPSETMPRTQGASFDMQVFF